MKRNYFFAIGIALAFNVLALTLCAQQSIRQVLVVNGGVFEFSEPYADHVTVATYNPSNGITTVFDTIYAESTQDVVVKGNHAFVSAKDSLVKYNIDTYTRDTAIGIIGVNQLAVYGDQLIVGRSYSATDTFVQIYNTDDLSLLYSVAEVSDETYGIAVVNDTAYVAVPGGWMSNVGKIAVIDLQGQQFIREVDLDTLGNGMRDLITNGEKIYAVNSMSWGSEYGVIADYDIATTDISTQIIDLPLGNGYGLNAFALDNDTLYAIFNAGIGKYNVSSQQIIDTTFIKPVSTIAEAVFDSIDNLFYVNLTDYASFGRGVIYDMNGDSIDSYEIGISAQAMAIDYREPVNVNILEYSNLNNNKIKIYPNPVKDVVNFYGENTKVNNIKITDLTGKILIENNIVNKNSITVSELSAGMYFITLELGKDRVVKKFFKQ